MERQSTGGIASGPGEVDMEIFLGLFIAIATVGLFCLVVAFLLTVSGG